jgi:glycosyltransferase involved in cell wall biosynthesis
VEDKVLFKGMIEPDELRLITQQAYAGITLFSPEGKSNYYSLANRFFDYVQAGIPQLCVNYPVYAELNNLVLVSVLTDELDPASLASKLNTLINDNALYNTLKKNCLNARQLWNWQEEEKILLDYYKRHF